MEKTPSCRCRRTATATWRGGCPIHDPELVHGLERPPAGEVAELDTDAVALSLPVRVLSRSPSQPLLWSRGLMASVLVLHTAMEEVDRKSERDGSVTTITRCFCGHEGPHYGHLLDEFERLAEPVTDLGWVEGQAES